MSRFFKLILIVLGILMLPKALDLILPFALGFAMYLLCRRPVRRMSAAGLNRSLAAGVTLLFMLTLILSFCALVFFMAYGERGRLPRLFQRLTAIGAESSLLRGFFSAFREELAGAAKALSLELISRLGDLGGAVMVLIFSLLSAFFFLRDERKLVDIISKNGGDGLLNAARSVGRTVRGALGGYVRAQAVLMGITFVILSVFLVLFGVDNAVLIALGIAFLDAIPVFGTGFVLLPWAAWQLLSGNSSLAFGLAALYGVCSLTRQLLEPKILSARIGLHPLLTLGGIFVGFKLLGLPGLVLGPAAVLIIVNFLQKSR